MASHSETVLDVENMPKDYIAAFTGTGEFREVKWRKLSLPNTLDTMFLKPTRMRIPPTCSDVKKHLEDKLPSNSSFRRFLSEIRRTDPSAGADSASSRESKRARHQTEFMAPTESSTNARSQ